MIYNGQVVQQEGVGPNKYIYSCYLFYYHITQDFRIWISKFCIRQVLGNPPLRNLCLCYYRRGVHLQLGNHKGKLTFKLMMSFCLVPVLPSSKLIV